MFDECIPHRPINKQAPIGTTGKARELLDEAIRMWTEISPVCTVDADKGDEWNTYFVWRGHRLALLTLGVEEVMATYKVEVDPASIRLKGVSMLNEDAGQKKFGAFCGKISCLESMLREWPTVVPDSVGNFRLLYGKGEYGRVEVDSTEMKYARVVSYSDTAKKGKWQYGDLDSMIKYTGKITRQIDAKDEKSIGRELASLMEL